MRGLIFSLCLVLGCSPVGGVDDDDTSEEPDPLPKFGSDFVGGDRPTLVHQPEGYDGLTAMPLVILLHGRGANPDVVDILFRWSAQVDALGFFLLLPESTLDSNGSPAWNSRPDSGEVADDLGYITGLIDSMEEQWAIDPDRIYVAGHSNGGFMTYRLACEIPERLAGVLNFAGLSPFTDESGCAPSEALSVLHVHGTEDSDVVYAPSDGRLGAEAVSALWAERAGCDQAQVEGPRLDLIAGIDGDETRVWDWADQCAGGHQVSLWTLEGGGHIPLFNSSFAEESLGWLLARSRAE
ncbi:MAG: hypothetical protein KDA24_06145 [Deltaproteobacteria bacterium]|nr:hypothetical protein [Deltaproteobacteria bacterium]